MGSLIQMICQRLSLSQVAMPFDQHPAFRSLPKSEQEYFRQWIADDAASFGYSGVITVGQALAALQSMYEAEKEVLAEGEPDSYGHRRRWIQRMESVINRLAEAGVKPEACWAD